MGTGSGSDARDASHPTQAGSASPAPTAESARDDQRAAVAAEMERTAYQKKAVSRLPASDVLDFAVSFFSDRGYRAGRTGRPNQVFVMGSREGGLPRVTGEITARADVGKPGTTLVTLDAVGEKLGPTMAEFHRALRAQWQASRAGRKAPPDS